MTTARTWAVALTGLEGALVEVEADLSNQTPDFRIIGLPDKALGEAVQRVHNASANCGLALPRRRLTVNLSPASVPKHGSAFDVAIAIASLATHGRMDAASIAQTVHIGELGLDGRLAARARCPPGRHGRGTGGSSSRDRAARQPCGGIARGRHRGRGGRLARRCGPMARRRRRGASPRTRPGTGTRARRARRDRARRGDRPARRGRGAHHRRRRRSSHAHERSARRGQDDAREQASRHPSRAR